jgi:hypothetical protein
MVSTEESSEDDFDERMSEVERRLEVAQYYRLLLNDSLFSTSTPAAKVVEAEIRAFIRERLEDLVGIRTPKVVKSSDFSDEEMTVLKQFTARVLKNSKLLEPNPEPTVKKASPPAQTPSKTASKPRVAPTVNKVKVAPPAKTPKAPKPSQKAQAKHKEPAAKSVQKDEPIVVEDISALSEGDLNEGQVFFDQKTSKTFRIVMNPQTDKLVKMDVTPRAVNPNRVPMPSGAQLEAVTHAHAVKSLESGGVKKYDVQTASRPGDTGLVNLAIAASLKGE